MHVKFVFTKKTQMCIITYIFTIEYKWLFFCHPPFCAVIKIAGFLSLHGTNVVKFLKEGICLLYFKLSAGIWYFSCARKMYIKRKKWKRCKIQTIVLCGLEISRTYAALHSIWLTSVRIICLWWFNAFPPEVDRWGVNNIFVRQYKKQ